MSISSYSVNGISCADEVLDFVKQERQGKTFSPKLSWMNKNNTPFNKKQFDINKNKHNFGIKFKSIYKQLADRAEYLEKRHRASIDLFKKNKEMYGIEGYDPVKFWNQQCYNTSRFNQNMLINTIWLQALANRVV